MKLYYLGEPSDGYGWGVANANLVAALQKYISVDLAPPTRQRFDAPVFVPIGGHDLAPIVKYEAPKVIGYCFTEWPLHEDAKRNARCYDLIFCGSTWNMQRLKNAGIKHVDVLIQGVDQNRFYTRPPSKRKGFVVFSGGKYEFRKGQDYVIAAMRQFMRVHSDVILLAAWHNPWPHTMKTMGDSWLIDMTDPFQGIEQDRVLLIRAIPNEKTPDIYEQAHIGLFPNRCEAGTNLVLCEFMACGRPAIATYATGHKDVFKTDDYEFLLKTGDYDAAGWFNPPVCDILYQLEKAYRYHKETPHMLTELGELARMQTTSLTWDSCARKVLAAAFPGHAFQEQDRGEPQSHPV